MECLWHHDACCYGILLICDSRSSTFSLYMPREVRLTTEKRGSFWYLRVKQNRSSTNQSITVTCNLNSLSSLQGPTQLKLLPRWSPKKRICFQGKPLFWYTLPLKPNELSLKFCRSYNWFPLSAVGYYQAAWVFMLPGTLKPSHALSFIFCYLQCRDFPLFPLHKKY